MASRASRLGWFAAMLFGQQHGWTSGTNSTCDSVVVSGVGEFDGTYTLVEDASDSLRPLFERLTGTEIYNIRWNRYGDERWGIYENSYHSYRTLDPALHPADIKLEWAKCYYSVTFSHCPPEAAELQPTIVCEGEEVATPAPTPPPTPTPTTEAPVPSPTSSPTTEAPVLPPTPSPTVEAPTSTTSALDSGSEGPTTLAPVPAPTEGLAESVSTDPPGEDTDNTAEIAIGIASVVVAFLGVVMGVLWGTASTVYVNFKCCNSSSSGSGPAVVVGARAPKETWFPVRMASSARVISQEPAFATAAVESQAIVTSVTAGLEHMSWTPIPAGTSMALHLTVDGRSYVFESCALSTTEGGGRRVVVGGIKRAKAVDGEIFARVVDVVTVDEASALAAAYPSRGRFRILWRCAPQVSSSATYAVVESIGEQSRVLLVR